jgi:hypothetical protein
MDTAVALVQAYLRINGYFTVAEYPVLEVLPHIPTRTVTDLDILAIRLHREPQAHGGPDATDLDSALGAELGAADMIVGEVKEGTPHLNPAMRDPAVLEAAFTRFGCCPADMAADLVDELLRTGRVVAPAGHVIRTVAFGNPHHIRATRAWHTVSLEHIIEFLSDYFHANWHAVGHTQLKDDVLGLFALMEKSRRATQPVDGPEYASPPQQPRAEP